MAVGEGSIQPGKSLAVETQMDKNNYLLRNIVYRQERTLKLRELELVFLQCPPPPLRELSKRKGSQMLFCFSKIGAYP